MSRLFEKIRRAIWLYKQPLTKKPESTGQPVSDLFLWRNSDQWSTYFDLIDITGLFIEPENNDKRFVKIYFFDSEGDLFNKTEIELERDKKTTLDLSSYTSSCKSEFGTFCVFHSATPEEVNKVGSYLAERGYVSFSYKKQPSRAYVHGNLDAISINMKNEFQMLGTKSVLARDYNLQYELTGPAKYNIGVVNSSDKLQDVKFKIISTTNDQVYYTKYKTINPRGSAVFTYDVSDDESFRVVITSNLVMARPLVFSMTEKLIDVFHG